jgi:hypothetical protein
MKTLDDLTNEARKQARGRVTVTPKAAEAMAEAIRFWQTLRAGADKPVER